RIPRVAARYGRISPGGRDVIDYRKPGSGKIAAHHGLGWNGCDVIGRANVPEAFVITEKESVVTAPVMGESHRATQAAAELILLEVGSPRIKKITGVQPGVAQELPDVAVILVGAGARDDDDIGAHGSPLLADVASGLHRELLNGVHRRIHGVAVEHGVV